jgi:hypothetical protein
MRSYLIRIDFTGYYGIKPGGYVGFTIETNRLPNSGLLCPQ